MQQRWEWAVCGTLGSTAGCSGPLVQHVRVHTGIQQYTAAPAPAVVKHYTKFDPAVSSIIILVRVLSLPVRLHANIKNANSRSMISVLAYIAYTDTICRAKEIDDAMIFIVLFVCKKIHTQNPNAPRRYTLPATS